MNLYQTLERRLGALVLDLLIVVAPIGALDLVVLWSEPPLLMLWLVAANFAGALYHILLQGWYGQTLGKMLLSVKVVRYEDEGPIGMYRSFLREIPTLLFNSVSLVGQASLAVSGTVFNRAEPEPVQNVIMFLAVPWVLAEVICALKTTKRRAIHDFIAGTVVIRTDLATEPKENQSAATI